MPFQALGRQPVGTPDWQTFDARSFRGGLNLRDTPSDLNDGDLAVANNVYLSVTGGITQRRGLTAVHFSPRGYPQIAATLRFHQSVYHGAVSNLDYYITQEVVPLAATGFINPVTGTVIFSIGAGTPAASWLVTYDPDNASGATDTLVVCVGSAGGPYAYDGATWSTQANWAPVAGARWCQVVNNVLWFGGIPSQPNLVQGAALGHPIGQPMPGFETFAMSSPVTGLGVVGQGAQAGLVVGMQSGASVIYGTGPTNFYQQDVPMTLDGVASGLSMIAYQGVIYFLGNQAVYSYDGYNPAQIISTKIEPILLRDPIAQLNGVPVMQGNRETYCAMMYNNKYHIFYDSVGNGKNLSCLVYDLIVQGWTTLSFKTAILSATVLNSVNDPTPLSAIVSGSDFGDTLGMAWLWDTLYASQEDAPPASAPVLAVVPTGGFFSPGTYYVATTYVTKNGETLPSPIASITVASGTTNSITVTATMPSPTSAVGINAYAGTQNKYTTMNQEIEALLTAPGQTVTGTIGAIGSNVAPPAAASQAISDQTEPGIWVPVASSFQTKYWKVGLPSTEKKIMRVYPEIFAQSFAGNVTISADYGTTRQQSTEILFGTQWNSTTDAVIPQPLLGPTKARVDCNLSGEAFSFGLAANTNAAASFFPGIQPPGWTFQGISGTFVQGSRV